MLRSESPLISWIKGPFERPSEAWGRRIRGVGGAAAAAVGIVFAFSQNSDKAGPGILAVLAGARAGTGLLNRRWARPCANLLVAFAAGLALLLPARKNNLGLSDMSTALGIPSWTLVVAFAVLLIYVAGDLTELVLRRRPTDAPPCPHCHKLPTEE